MDMIVNCTFKSRDRVAKQSNTRMNLGSASGMESMNTRTKEMGFVLCWAKRNKTQKGGGRDCRAKVVLHFHCYDMSHVSDHS